MQGRAPNLLGPRHSTLAGLVKFLAVGCGLNEFSPKENIDLIISANLMAVYLKPQASSLKPQASSLKPQASSLKPQASSLTPQACSPDSVA
jgi:hypothetical protein